MIGIIMFFAALAMLLIGFPVAFTFGAVSVFFGLAAGSLLILVLICLHLCHLEFIQLCKIQF